MATAKSIKGITIEIGCGTTKLSKALKGVDDQSQDLAASLKYVDKLLDFDPGNTELLAEKQKLLAEAVDTSANRLQALHDVQDQVKRQYASGEIGQRAYLDFQHEVARTEKKLESLQEESRKTANALNGIGDESRETGADLGKLRSGADDATEGLEGLTSTIGIVGKGVGIAAAGISAAVAGIRSIEESTREQREEMAKLETSFEAAAHTADDARIAYRNLYRLLGETDQSVEAAQQISLLAGNTEQVTKWSGLAAGVVARFGDALQPETFFEAANETLKLNEATGAFTQLLEGSGVYSVEEYRKKLASLTKKSERLAYQQLGPGALAVDQFNDKLAACSNEAERQALMLETVENLLGDAADAYNERNAAVLEARDADAKFQEAMAKVGEKVAPLATDLKNFAAGLINDALPSVELGVDSLYELAGAFADVRRELVEEWPEIVEWWGEAFGAITGSINDWGTAVREAAQEIMDTTDLAEEELGQNSAAMIGHAQELTDGMSLAAYGVYDAWIGAGATFADVCGGMAQSYQETVDYIERQKIRIPTPEVPKFSISGSFDIGNNRVPTINVLWNAQGGIFTRPTVLPALNGTLQGFGEAGQEAILPLNSFYENLERIVDRRSGPQSIVFEPHVTVYQQSGEDGEAVAQRAVDMMMDMFSEEVGGLGYRSQ